MTGTILERCEARGMQMTGHRRIVAELLETATDHPDVEDLHARAQARDPSISVISVYRTVRLLLDAGILETVQFGDGRTRYEDTGRGHHGHLIDLTTGEIVEFADPEIEALQQKIAERLGYRLKGHRTELYAVPKGKD